MRCSSAAGRSTASCWAASAWGSAPQASRLLRRRGNGFVGGLGTVPGGSLMRRRDFLEACGSSAAGVALGTGFVSLAAAPRPLAVGPGPQLFLDDYLVGRLDGLVRRVELPERLPGPVLDSKTFGTTQPHLTVLRDDAGPRYRLWYNRGPAVWHAESADGLRWARPRIAWDLPRGYGASLVDDG